jgi:RND family efflux transporter MFP subunit
MNYDSRIEAPAEAFDQADLVGFGEESGGSWRKIAAVVVLILAALVAIWFFSRESTPSAEAVGEDAQAPVVTVIVPGKTTIVGAINASGTLAARRELPVGSVGEGGQVVSVLVEPGQWVRQGQVLAVIDRSVQTQQQIGQAAQIQVSVADAALAQANLDRATKLAANGFVSKADIDRLTATRDAARARVGVARAQLGQLRAQAARLNIVAPAAGLVLERKIEPGQVVGGGSGVLFRIAKGGEMEMKALLGETDMALLAPGVSAEVVPAGGTRAFIGQIWQIAPVIDPMSRQGIARIALAYAPELRPGGFASVTIRAGSVVAPLLPDSAILSDEQGEYVFVIGKDNKVERRKVKSGMVTDNGIAVASGLTGNERIVLRAGSFLAPGETVKPVAAKP